MCDFRFLQRERELEALQEAVEFRLDPFGLALAPVTEHDEI